MVALKYREMIRQRYQEIRDKNNKYISQKHEEDMHHDNGTANELDDTLPSDVEPMKNEIVHEPTRKNEIVHDIIKKPKHYEIYTIEPVSFIMKNGLEFWRGNIIKYAMRSGIKRYEGQTKDQSEITDLKKCIRYCEMRINQLEGKEPNATD